jgi:F-type H+-transporting ATPase subunit b
VKPTLLVKTAICCLFVVAATAERASAAAAAAPTGTAAHADGGHGGDGHGGDGHGGHGHGLGHEPANTDPSEIKGDLAIFTAVVFLLLVVILRKFAWKPISEGLEKRENHIAHEIAAAERANAEAKHLLADYQKKLDAAQHEVRAILDEARRDAEHTAGQIAAKAKADAEAEMRRALREVETAKDQALKDLAETAATLATDLAGKLLQQKLQPADHARLIDEAMAKFPKGKVGLN